MSNVFSLLCLCVCVCVRVCVCVCVSVCVCISINQCEIRIFLSSLRVNYSCCGSSWPSVNTQLDRVII